MIQKTNNRMTWCRILIILNLTFIWGNSMIPAEGSSMLSEWVREILSSVIPPAAESESGFLLRKLAHFSEFACLGFLLSWHFAMVQQKKPCIAGTALLTGFLCACADETIQLFSPGRGPSPVDVGIDTAGVAFGIGLLLLGQYIYQKNHKPMEALT